MFLLSQANEWVAILANWLSLASLLVSIYAAVTISRVRRDMAGRATLPMIIVALEESNLALIEMLGDFDANRRQFESQLARCEANLRALASSRNATAPRARMLAQRISTFGELGGSTGRGTTTSQIDEAWRIHALLGGLIEELRRVSFMQQIGG